MDLSQPKYNLIKNIIFLGNKKMAFVKYIGIELRP